jgi:RNA-dependent RNA polymerase
MVIDHATNGVAITIDNYVPQALVKFMPDWHHPEVPSKCHVDYYESSRAIGHLFRNVNMHELPDRIPVVSPGEARPLEDAISCALAPLVRSALDMTFSSIQTMGTRAGAEDLHAWYALEMQFIGMAHSMSTSPDACLSEEEVVLGTILGKCSQSCWRTDCANHMRMHTEVLVSNLRAQINTVHSLPSTTEDLYSSLWDAWAMWSWAQHHREEPFIQTYSLVALGLIFELLECFGALPNF